MHSLEIADHIDRLDIERAIFDACRANEKREAKTVRGLEVQFAPLDWQESEHRATVRDGRGVICAFATVDRFDC